MTNSYSLLTNQEGINHTATLNKRGEYNKRKQNQIALALYEYSKCKYAKEKNKLEFQEINTSHIISKTECTYKTLLKHLKFFESEGIVFITRGKTKRVGRKIFRAPQNIYNVNFEKLKDWLINKGLVKKPVKPNLPSNKYKEKKIINRRNVFYIDGKEIKEEVTTLDAFLSENLGGIYRTALRTQQQMPLEYEQIEFIAATFRQVVGNVVKKASELTRMLLGWIKNRYAQIVRNPKAKSQYSMWMKPCSFVKYHYDRLDDCFVEQAQESITLSKRYSTLQQGWIPSRDAVYQASQAVIAFAGNQRMLESTFFKILGSTLISRKIGGKTMQADAGSKVEKKPEKLNAKLIEWKPNITILLRNEITHAFKENVFLPKLDRVGIGKMKNKYGDTVEVIYVAFNLAETFVNTLEFSSWHYDSISSILRRLLPQNYGVVKFVSAFDIDNYSECELKTDLIDVKSVEKIAVKAKEKMDLSGVKWSDEVLQKAKANFTGVDIEAVGVRDDFGWKTTFITLKNDFISEATEQKIKEYFSKLTGAFMIFVLTDGEF